MLTTSIGMNAWCSADSQSTRYGEILGYEVRVVGCGSHQAANVIGGYPVTDAHIDKTRQCEIPTLRNS